MNVIFMICRQIVLNCPYNYSVFLTPKRVVIFSGFERTFTTAKSFETNVCKALHTMLLNCFHHYQRHCHCHAFNQCAQISNQEARPQEIRLGGKFLLRQTDITNTMVRTRPLAEKECTKPTVSIFSTALPDTPYFQKVLAPHVKLSALNLYRTG